MKIRNPNPEIRNKRAEKIGRLKNGKTRFIRFPAFQTIRICMSAAFNHPAHFQSRPFQTLHRIGALPRRIASSASACLPMNCSPASQVPMRLSRSSSWWWSGAAILSIVVGAAFLVVRHQRDAPRRSAIAVLANVERALVSADPSKSLPLFHIPSAAAEKSPAE